MKAPPYLKFFIRPTDSDDFVFCIENNRGSPTTTILDQDDKIIARGFKELYKYWNDKGLWLC